MELQSQLKSPKDKLLKGPNLWVCQVVSLQWDYPVDKPLSDIDLTVGQNFQGRMRMRHNLSLERGH